MNTRQLEECSSCNDCSECPHGYTLGGKYWKCGANKTQKEVITEIMEYNNENYEEMPAIE